MMGHAYDLSIYEVGTAGLRQVQSQSTQGYTARACVQKH